MKKIIFAAILITLVVSLKAWPHGNGMSGAGKRCNDFTTREEAGMPEGNFEKKDNWVLTKKLEYGGYTYHVYKDKTRPSLQVAAIKAVSKMALDWTKEVLMWERDDKRYLTRPLNPDDGVRVNYIDRKRKPEVLDLTNFVKIIEQKSRP